MATSKLVWICGLHLTYTTLSRQEVVEGQCGRSRAALRRKSCPVLIHHRHRHISVPDNKSVRRMRSTRAPPPPSDFMCRYPNQRNAADRYAIPSFTHKSNSTDHRQRRKNPMVRAASAIRTNKEELVLLLRTFISLHTTSMRGGKVTQRHGIRAVRASHDILVFNYVYLILIMLPVLLTE